MPPTMPNSTGPNARVDGYCPRHAARTRARRCPAGPPRPAVDAVAQRVSADALPVSGLRTAEMEQMRKLVWELRAGAKRLVERT